MSLTVEAKAWKILLCKYLKEVYNKKMMDISTFTEKQLKQLSRPIVDLEDVRFSMEVLSKIRDNEIRIDMDLGPIEVLNLLQATTLCIQTYCMFDHRMFASY